MNETQNTQELHDTQNAQNVQRLLRIHGPEMNFTEQQPPKKPRTHRTGKIVAIVAAIAVLCGGAGFGGAFAANKASQLLIGGASQSESVNSSGGERFRKQRPRGRAGRTEHASVRRCRPHLLRNCRAQQRRHIRLHKRPGIRSQGFHRIY